MYGCFRFSARTATSHLKTHGIALSSCWWWIARLVRMGMNIPMSLWCAVGHHKTQVSIYGEHETHSIFICTFLKGINLSNGCRGFESSTVIWVCHSHFEFAAVILSLPQPFWVCRSHFEYDTAIWQAIAIELSITLAYQLAVAHSKWLWKTWVLHIQLRRTRVPHSHLMKLHLLEKSVW